MIRRIIIFLAIFLTGISSIPARGLYASSPLTDEEKAWLRAHDGKIVLAPETNYPPIHFIDDKGAFSGMAEDYTDILEKRLGIRFKKVTVHKWADMLKKAQNREIDVIMTIVDTPERREYFNFTSPYLNTPTMIISRQSDTSINSMEDLYGKKVTTTKGYQINNYIEKNYPGLAVIPVHDELASIKMVAAGEAQAALVQLDVASYYIEKLNITNLRVAGKTGHVYAFSIGSRNDWPILNSILEKGLCSISPQEREDIHKKWIHLEQESAPVDRALIRLTAIIAASAVGLILFLFIFFRFLRKAMHGEHTEGLSSGTEQFQSRKYLRTTAPFIISMVFLAGLIFTGIYYVILKNGTTPVELTMEEQKWLRENDYRMKIAVDPMWAPIEFLDDKEGFSGYSADMIRIIEKRLNFHFRIVPTKSWSETMAMARSGQIEVIGSIMETPERKTYLDFTTPHLVVQSVILVRKSDKRSLTLADLSNTSTAIVKGYAIEDHIKAKYPRIPVHFVDNETEGMKKLSFAEIDAMIITLPAASWLIEKEGFTNFRIAGDANFDYPLSIASRRDFPMLGHILEKTRNSISSDELKDLRKKWFGLKYAEKPDDNFLTILMVSTGIFIFIIILILQWNRSLKKIVNIRSQELANELAERTRAEQEAQQQRDFNSIFIQASPLFYIALDRHGRILLMNDSALRSLGYGIDEVSGREFISLCVVEEDREEALAIQSSLTAAPSDSTSQLEIRSRSGRIMTVEWYSRSLFNRDGEFEFLFSMGTDITERKHTEEMMILTEKMMTVAGLAAGMAHEINNPLGIIMLAAESIRRRFDTQNAQNIRTAESLHLDLSQMAGYLEKREIFKYLESIQNAGSRAAKIVSNMLQFSRTAGTDRTSTDLNKLIDDSVELVSSDYDMKRNYDFKHIAIKKEYDKALSRVSCIKNEIEQVIFNILKNAAHALNEKHEEGFMPQITLRTMEQAGRAIIQISDNGPGMEEGVRHRIFEPFYTTKPVGDGTGLGLSVSYFIITQNHHGSITADSIPGEGSTFTISLPLR